MQLDSERGYVAAFYVQPAYTSCTSSDINIGIELNEMVCDATASMIAAFCDSRLVKQPAFKRAVLPNIEVFL